ncbi:MAG: anti-sigma factor family protein [Acidobacteriota bacterium]
MKCREVELLLPDLADGTLKTEEAARVEEHLSRCTSCADDAALLKETFAMLRADEEELPPAHYFPTLLPKIRARLEHHEHPGIFALPAWLGKAAAPAALMAAAVVLVVLFRAFEPTEEFAPLKTIIEQASGDEIASLVVSPTEAYSGDFGIPSNDVLLEAMPEAGTAVADEMKEELLAATDTDLQPTESGVLSVDKTLDDLDDETVSQVLDRMNEQPTL